LAVSNVSPTESRAASDQVQKQLRRLFTIFFSTSLAEPAQAGCLGLGGSQPFIRHFNGCRRLELTSLLQRKGNHRTSEVSFC
jgi:hypothetical protein